MTKTEKGYDDIANRDKNLNSTAEILFFNAAWCPHCIKSKPEWEKFTKEYNGKRINGYKIVCKNVDCTDDENEQSNALMQKYKIEGYPTVIAVIDDKVVEYQAKVTFENLEKFANEL